MDLVPTGSTATSWIAAWNLALFVGVAFGCISYPWLSHNYGRRLPLNIGAVFIVVGGGMQAGTVHAAMLLIARIVLGTGMGHILVGTPMYQAEIAPTASRGLMVGMHACLLGGGIALAQWMGVAFFHVKGQASWRAPLAIQCAPAVIFLCFSFLLPESPRWRKF